MIDSLSSLLNADLTHLNPKSMAERDSKHLFYLIEILTAIKTHLSTSKSVAKDEEPECCCLNSPSSDSLTDSVSICPDCYTESSESCSCNSLPSSESSSDTKRSESSSPTGSSDTITEDCHPIDRRESINSLPIVIKHDKTPTKPKRKPLLPTYGTKYGHQDPKSLTQQLEAFEIKSTDIKTLMATLKIAKEDGFALELGHRLHEALRLEEEAKRIESQVERYIRDQYPDRQRITSQSPVRKLSTMSKSTGSIPSTVNRSKFVARKPNLNRSRSTGHVYRGEDGPRSRSTSLESFLSKFAPNSIPPETKKKLKLMEMSHKTMMNNLRDDLRNRESRGHQLLRQAVEKELKRSQMMRREIDRLDQMKIRQETELNQFNRDKLKKQLRSEKARVKQMVNNFYLESKSKFQSAQSKQDQLIKKEFGQQLKQEKENLIHLKHDKKVTDGIEYEKRKRFLESFESLYDQKYEMIKDQLSKEESELKNRIKTNSQLLNDIKKQIKSTISKI